MARFVRLGHCILNAEAVTFVTHQYDPQAGGAHVRIGFLHGTEIAIPVHDLVSDHAGAPDAALARVLEALTGAA